MALTKGVSFNNVRTFVIESYGAEGWANTLALFERPEREVLESVLAIGWYDLGLYARLIRAIDRRFGDGDLRLTHAMGRYEAEKDLPTIHQWLVRLIRPSIAVDQMSKYWRRFQSTGEWMAERRGEREVIARLSGWGVVDAALCRELVGYLQRMLELLGGGDVTLEHTRCRARGEPDGGGGLGGLGSLGGLGGLGSLDYCEFRARYRVRQDRDEPGASSRTGMDRSILLEVLRGPSSSIPPPSYEGASSGPESRPELGKADRTPLGSTARFRSSRPPPSSPGQDGPRSDRWGGSPSPAMPTSASRPSTIPAPPSTSRPSAVPAPPSVSASGPASTSRPPAMSRPPPLSQPPPNAGPLSTRGRPRR